MISTGKIQVFLLHFAGGNCYSFQFMKPFFPAEFEFCPMELPGRGKRMSEKLLIDTDEAVNDYINQIKSRRNQNPYMIYGHSMGASLGLLVAKKMEELGDAPARLIVSGNAGPGTRDDKRRSIMGDEELKADLRKLGGIPDQVFENKELYDFFVPIMRADFAVLENEKELGNDFKISTPVTALMGDQEETVAKIKNWRNFVSNEFEHYILKGNHFFINDQPAKIVNTIKVAYDRSLVSKY